MSQVSKKKEEEKKKKKTRWGGVGDGVALSSFMFPFSSQSFTFLPPLSTVLVSSALQSAVS